MGIVFSIKPSLVVIPCGIFPYDAMVIFGEYDGRMEKRVAPASISTASSGASPCTTRTGRWTSPRLPSSTVEADTRGPQGSGRTIWPPCWG